MLIVGLTGGIGSGKSTVCRLFQELGAPVVDADLIAHRLTQPNQPATREILQTFGQDYLLADGSLDRRRLRDLIFSDDQQRIRLERLLHPLIKNAMQEEAARLTAPYAIFAIPLLLEQKWEGMVERILVIDCPEEAQLERVAKRDHTTAAQARAIMAKQVDRNTRLSSADDIIDNSHGLEALRHQVAALHRRYLKLATD